MMSIIDHELKQHYSLRASSGIELNKNENENTNIGLAKMFMNARFVSQSTGGFSFFCDADPWYVHGVCALQSSHTDWTKNNSL